MCELTHQIILCSCAEKNENINLINPHQWTLNRYLGPTESTMRGRLLAPSQFLDDQIGIDQILTEMNLRNCFDFNYTPQERDQLCINNGLENPDYKYFCLIYKNGNWQPGRNPAFKRSKLEIIKEGKIGFLKKD